MTCSPGSKERINQHAGTLSGGEQQMLAIARGLMYDPELIMLDEPSLGLAPIVVEEILETVPAPSRNRARRYCSSSRTPTWPCRSPTAPICWKTASSSRAAPAGELHSDDSIRKAYLGGWEKAAYHGRNTVQTGDFANAGRHRRRGHGLRRCHPRLCGTER